MFTEFLDDYDANWDWQGQQAFQHSKTDIAFSPGVTGAFTINITPLKNVEISFPGKYVGSQSLDNTQNETRKLDAFYVQDARMIITFRNKLFREWTIIGQANNIFDMKYEPNGYAYSYLLDGALTTDNYYFPMAGTNFMFGLNIRL